MKIDFDGHVVLVTGATRGMVMRFAEDFSTGTKTREIEALNGEAREKGLKRIYYCVDFRDHESTATFLDALGKYEKIDVCVNNAGTNKIEYIDKTDPEDFEDIMKVNLRAPYLVLREVSPIMKKNRYGRIVNISSIWGVISREKRSMYSTTKFGINGLTVSASNDLAPYNILVNSVSPGFIMTELTRRILNEKEMEELALQVPVRRFAEPEEISRIVLFVTSRQNTFMTGQNLIVDGGFVNV
ncbi:MAG: SDR family oxidoreductase [Deltaproteobacteria bacterium]|nr:SDR family oxidoreductase [Deltaproteobacteria bacterium]